MGGLTPWAGPGASQNGLQEPGSILVHFWSPLWHQTEAQNVQQIYFSEKVRKLLEMYVFAPRAGEKLDGEGQWSPNDVFLRSGGL